jgi:uncharacterized membrane protein YhaH (DUF805 family)
MNIDFAYLYTSVEGRIGRKDFWLGVLGFVVVGIIVLVIIGPLFGMMSFMGRLISFLLSLIFAYPYYCLAGKRFQDRNKPASLAWIGVVFGVLQSFTALIGLTGDMYSRGVLDYLFGIAGLIIGIWFLVELGFLHGTIGPNQYGADPVGEPRTA